jgi:Protein of unknown function (DUF3467)
MCDTANVEEDRGPEPAEAERWIQEAETTVYANVVSVNPGPFDVSLTFGEQNHSRQRPEGVETHAVVKVSMSWGHLKSMVPLLAKVVASYEQQFGEIPAPGFDTMWKE